MLLIGVWAFIRGDHNWLDAGCYPVEGKSPIMVQVKESFCNLILQPGVHKVTSLPVMPREGVRQYLEIYL